MDGGISQRTRDDDVQSTVCSFQRQTGNWEPILIDLFVCFLSTLNEQLPVGGNLLRDERNGRKDEPAGRRIIMTTIAGDTCARAMKLGGVFLHILLLVHCVGTDGQDAVVRTFISHTRS